MARNPFRKSPPKKRRVLRAVVRTAVGFAVAASLAAAGKRVVARKSADTTPATDETEATS